MMLVACQLSNLNNIIYNLTHQLIFLPNPVTAEILLQGPEKPEKFNFPGPGNDLEFYKIRKRSRNIIEKILAVKKFANWTKSQPLLPKVDKIPFS